MNWSKEVVYIPYFRYYKPHLNRSPPWIEAAPKCSFTVLKIGKCTKPWIEAAPKGLKNKYKPGL